MSGKRTRSQGLSGRIAVGSPKKLKLNHQNSYLYKTLEESGLSLRFPPEKSIINQETIHIIRNIKKNLEKHVDYPRNVSELFINLQKECQEINVFKHYLFPNIVRRTEDSPDESFISDSLFKILLSVPILQNKLTDYIFEKAVDLAAESKCGPWIQMILKCFSSLDSILNTDKMSTHLINLLDITTEKMVRLEIITAIPDIIGDQEHSNIAAEMSRILNEDHDLIPAILDCLSYLCLSDEQYEQLQKKTLNILMTLTKCTYFSNFVKFLLMPGRMNDPAYFEAVQGIRNSLTWPASIARPQELATSQVLTAAAIRSSMLSSKVISNAWLKVVSVCKTSSEHKPFDFVILLIAYSTSEEKQKQVENVIKKQIKLEVLKEDLLDECFDKFVPILKENLRTLISLTNSLLKTKGDPMVELFASRLYTLMFSKLDDCCQTVVAELLQLGLDCQQAVMSILLILNDVATKDMSLLKPQSVQMLTLLDRMDNMSLNEIRAVMNLLCGLAYSYENSVIRDDIHMIIRKELGSSIPKIKIQGILAGLHAVKYLMRTNNGNDQTADFPDDVSYSSVTFLAEGDLREAAQVIELISRSTRQFPDMIAFFYDELTSIIESASTINKNFLSWLTDAVTNDLQQNFIVDAIDTDRIGDIKLGMQYCINADSEMDEPIAINIAGLTLQPKIVVNIGILSPLFQLVQTLHYKQHDGTLSSIDALLGCPVIMPKFDVDLIEDMDNATVHNLLDCLVHCVNWFRELLNAFATQDDDALKTKILHRVLQIEEIETLISEVLLKCKVSYKLPSSIFNINKYTGEQTEKKSSKVQKTKAQKKTNLEETVLPETARTQATQNNNSVKSKINIMHNMPLRHLSLNLLHLLNNEIGDASDESNCKLNIKTLNFLLKCINSKLENVLVSKIKRKTFLTKQEQNLYDANKAKECANSVSVVLPKMMEHLIFVVSYLDTHIPSDTEDDSEFVYTPEMIDYLSCLESIYSMYTTYFKWVGFKNHHHNALLKSSLRSIAAADGNANIISLKELLLATAKYFQKHEKYCMFLTIAVSLIELLKTINDYSDNRIILKLLRNTAQNFLSQQWKTVDGVPEKGLWYNQSVDKLAHIFFINNEVLALKNLSLQIANEIKSLKSRNDTLASFKSINKANFAIMFRNLGTAVCESSKSRLSRGLTNAEHLELWKDVAIILKNMSDIAKTLETRNNLSAFFKKSVPILKLFLSQAIPILELELKNKTEEVLEILKILQQSTRFLQSLCCHSRLKKDNVLMSKVPYMRELLEKLIYKVKAALAANNCSEAFWMGTLKNKDIHGEIIATQQLTESEEPVEDYDEQLPEDEDSDDSDDVINPDSKSVVEER